jgi:acetyl esterase/lipase
MSARISGLAGLAILWGVAVLAQAEPKPKPKPTPVPPGVRVERDLAYVANGHERQKLDIYLPERASGSYPLVVWVHGGGWRGGSKDQCPAASLATRGYVVASVGYRLSQHATFPAQIEDCKAAIRWLRAHAQKYHIDPERVGVWGASAGGHLVALLGTSGGVKELEGSLGHPDQSSRVQAVVDWFGPADLLKMTAMRKDPKSAVGLLLGGSVEENPDKARKASPVTYVTPDDPPFLIMHGDADKLVPLEQSEVLADALKKAGVEVTFIVHKGAGHGGPAFNAPESRKQIEEFFDKHLKKGASK